MLAVIHHMILAGVKSRDRFGKKRPIRTLERLLGTDFQPRFRNEVKISCQLAFCHFNPMWGCFYGSPCCYIPYVIIPSSYLLLTCGKT